MTTRPNDYVFATGTFAPGMTKREYFAAYALGALWSASSIESSQARAIMEEAGIPYAPGVTIRFMELHAKLAVKQADELIKALNAED